MLSVDLTILIVYHSIHAPAAVVTKDWTFSKQNLQRLGCESISVFLLFCFCFREFAVILPEAGRTPTTHETIRSPDLRNMASGGDDEQERFPQFTPLNYEMPSWQIEWNKPWYQQFEEKRNIQSKFNSIHYIFLVLQNTIFVTFQLLFSQFHVFQVTRVQSLQHARQMVVLSFDSWCNKGNAFFPPRIILVCKFHFEYLWFCLPESRAWLKNSRFLVEHYNWWRHKW